MTAHEAARLYQAALEYRRAAGGRYTTDEELLECDEAVRDGLAQAERAWLGATAA